jgi:hypothetical protein
LILQEFPALNLYTATFGAGSGVPIKEAPPSFFTPGLWTMTAPADADVGPFQASLVLPPTVHWTNRDSLSIMDRATDIPIIWDPQGYSANDVMTVTLSSGACYLDPGTNATGLICRVHAQDGRLVLPGALLQQLAPTPAVQALGSLQLQVAPHPQHLQRFAFPQSGVDPLAIMSYQFSEQIVVTVR